jgi:hypothetical protein
MSRGAYNKFGYIGYIRAVIDGRGTNFCDACVCFLNRMQGHKHRIARLVKDGLDSKIGIKRFLGLN